MDQVSQSSCLNILLNIKITYPLFSFPDEEKIQPVSFNLHSDDDEAVPPKVTDERADTSNEEWDIQIALVAGFQNIDLCLNTDLDFSKAIGNFKTTNSEY